MKRELVVGGSLLAVVLATVLGAVLFPGALADRSEPQPDGELRMEEISLSAEEVGGERLALTTDVRLAHTDGASENVTVELRAVESDSELVAASRTIGVGGIEGDSEVSATGTLRIERGGDYHIEAIIYRDGVRATTGSKTVQGTGALTPGYPDSPVEFHRFARHDFPAIDYEITDSGGDSATLDVESYVTNGGEAPAEGLSLVLKARQVESGIVASEQEIDVDSISASQTARPGTDLTVPAGYNYYLDAILFNDGVIVDTARSGASLDPTERVQANETERDVEFEVGDFDSRDRPDDDQTPDGDGGDGMSEADSDGAGPGFGVAVGILAVAIGLGLRARGRTGGKQ
jgi:hypothetical protein